MSLSHDEQVLVIPAEEFHRLGLFQGFCADVERYLPRLLDPALLRFLPRSQAEEDPSFKQIIPYVVFRCGSALFHYERGDKGTEKRLRALRSLGVGGHVSTDDVQSGGDLYRTGMQREVSEEVMLESAYRERCLGLINDDRTPVGQVHLGVVHVFELDEPRVRPREDTLARVGFAPISQLRQEKEHFETWSQFLLDAAVF